MLFITNRLPTGSIQAATHPIFDFDLSNNAAGNSVFFCERHAERNYTELGSIAFLSRLKTSNYRQILIYIHGFSNLPEDAFKAADEFQSLCDQRKAQEVLVVPVIWPCDNDAGIVKDYWDDQKSADQSAFAFSRVLQKFLQWRNSPNYNPQSDPCLKRINLLAHSMGNRVLRETLAVWNKYDLPDGVPLIFRNSFLIAADIVNESLHRGQPGELICNASRNVAVYYASDDLALRASKAANLKNKIASRRLGHSGPENMDLTPNNVYALDCDDVNNLYDNPKGHSYFRYDQTGNRPGVVFDNIFDAIESGRVTNVDPITRRGILR